MPFASPLQRERRTESPTIDGLPSIICRWLPNRRSLVLGFLIHFRAKIRVDPWLKTSCVPASSVKIRVHPWLFLGELFVQRIASCDSPLPIWGEDEGEGTLFGLAKLRFGA